MSFENMSVDQLENFIVQKKESISDMVSTFNPEFSININYYSSEVKFYIRHKTKNWSDLVDVTVNSRGETRFSHGSGAWNRDKFSEEELMNASIEGFLIANSIMNMKIEISNVLKEIGRIEQAKNNAKYNQDILDQNKAKEDICAHLNANYIKASSKAILESIRKTGKAEIIRSAGFNYSSKEFNKEVICIKDVNFNASSRLNLYSFHYDSSKTYSEDMRFSFKNHTTIAKLDRFCLDSYIFNKEVYEKCLQD